MLKKKRSPTAFAPRTGGEKKIKIKLLFISLNRVVRISCLSPFNKTVPSSGNGIQWNPHDVTNVHSTLSFCFGCHPCRKFHTLMIYAIFYNLSRVPNGNTRTATNDYFNNWLLCGLFFWLIDETDFLKRTVQTVHKHKLATIPFLEWSVRN